MKRDEKVTKHDAEELMNFKAYISYKDTSADLREVYRRLAEKYRMEYAS